jgi:hypothetical protein
LAAQTLFEVVSILPRRLFCLALVGVGITVLATLVVGVPVIALLLSLSI